MLLRNKRTFGTLGNGNAQMEDTAKVLCREDEVIAAVLLNDIVVPHLLLSPRHLVHVENQAVVCDVGFERIARKGQHMVVAHLEMSAVVVEGSTCLDVMRRVDKESFTKDMDRRVGHIVRRKKVALHCLKFEFIWGG